MITLDPITVAVAGAGEEAARIARALRGCDAVEVTRITGASEEELNDQLASDGVDAIAFVTPLPDLAVSVRRALMANRHVLIAGPAALSSAQLISLDDLARRRSRVVTLDAGFAADERIAFVRKMAASPGALWRPRYIRAVRTGAERHTLDEIAIAELACIFSIMGASPATISAVGPRIDDECGHAAAAMLTMTFDGGPVASVDISLIESAHRRDITVACDGRTIVLDAFDTRAPLQIQAAGRHRGPQDGHAWAENVIEFPVAAAPLDRTAAAAAEFIAAVRSRDLAAINLAASAAAAAAWELARDSIAAGGELRRMDDDDASGRATRPELHIIHGGGQAHPHAAPPDLTLIRRRNA